MTGWHCFVLLLQGQLPVKVTLSWSGPWCVARFGRLVALLSLWSCCKLKLIRTCAPRFFHNFLTSFLHFMQYPNIFYYPYWCWNFFLDWYWNFMVFYFVFSYSRYFKYTCRLYLNKNDEQLCNFYSTHVKKNVSYL